MRLVTAETSDGRGIFTRYGDIIQVLLLIFFTMRIAGKTRLFHNCNPDFSLSPIL